MLVLAALCGAAQSKEAAPLAQDPLLEARVLRIARGLRCMVCQNQSLADSHADLAADLKDQIREQLRSGRSDRQVVDFMVQRYGDFVLYRPPLKPSTWLLWLGPFLLLCGGVIGLVAALLRRARQTPPPLSSEDQRRALALLDEGRDAGSP
jgi:cytochrome c-type biogenesis protein CcmH